MSIVRFSNLVCSPANDLYMLVWKISAQLKILVLIWASEHPYFLPCIQRSLQQWFYQILIPWVKTAQEFQALYTHNYTDGPNTCILWPWLALMSNGGPSFRANLCLGQLATTLLTSVSVEPSFTPSGSARISATLMKPPIYNIPPIATEHVIHACRTEIVNHPDTPYIHIYTVEPQTPLGPMLPGPDYRGVPQVPLYRLVTFRTRTSVSLYSEVSHCNSG